MPFQPPGVTVIEASAPMRPSKVVLTAQATLVGGKAPKAIGPTSTDLGPLETREEAAAAGLKRLSSFRADDDEVEEVRLLVMPVFCDMRLTLYVLTAAQEEAYL